MRILMTCAVLCGVALCSPAVRAHTCECDHEIALDDNRVDGSGYLPGDRVCIMAGDRPDLVIDDVVGTAEQPVILINCDGKVRAGGPEAGVGFAIRGSVHFRLTGTGDPEHTYGIEIVGSRPSAQGLAIGGLSSDFEVDHVEVHHAGFAGIMSKTDPSCDDRDLSGFVQENCSFHDNYIHDVGGEGFYLGYSFFPERETDCDGQTVTLRAHPMRNIEVYDNLVERSGWDGIQMSAVIEGGLIARNAVVDFGREDELYQNHGIQIGGGTSGVVAQNLIARGPGIGIFWLGWGGAQVYNNVIVDVGGDGINCQDRTELAGAPFWFVHNTILRPGRDGIRMHATLAAGSAFVNNLVVDAAEAPETHFGDFDWTVEGNLFVDSVAEAGFVDAAGGDYHLAAGSAGVDQGVAFTPADVSTDYDGLLRDSQPDVGAYERDGTEPSGGGVAGPDVAVALAGGSGGDDSGGCGCGSTGSQAPAGGVLLLGLIWWLRKRRQGRQPARQNAQDLADTQ